MVAAYGFDYRTEAEAAVAESRTTMLGIAIGTVVTGFLIALAFAYSLSRPIFENIAAVELPNETTGVVCSSEPAGVTGGSEGAGRAIAAA